MLFVPYILQFQVMYEYARLEHAVCGMIWQKRGYGRQLMEYGKKIGKHREMEW